jgi:hypothetical protein
VRALANLQEHPEDRDRLIQDRSLIPAAVEEFLRYEAPVMGLCRTATRDVEVGGRQIAEGEKVLLLYTKALPIASVVVSSPPARIRAMKPISSMSSSRLPSRSRRKALSSRPRSSHVRADWARSPSRRASAPTMSSSQTKPSDRSCRAGVQR